MTRTVGWRGRLLARVGAVTVTLLCASAFEHLMVKMGHGQGDFVRARGWIFRPGSQAEFVSAEFRHKVRVSAQGLRDREFSIPKPPGTLRVAVVGDSLTYGYGVEAEQTWVKQLENQLRTRYPGRNVEVVNLGKPGGEPNAYLGVCVTTLALLEADLLLVGLTQGDDLTQLALLSQAETAKAATPDPGTWLATVAFPLSAARVKAIHQTDDHDLLAALRHQAGAVLARLDARAAARYRALDPEVRGHFERGLINPLLVEAGCRFPDLYAPLLDARSDAMRAAARALPPILRRFDELCRRVNTPWAVVSVPHGVYVSPDVLQGRRRLGYTAPDDLLRTDVPERVARECCREAGVPFVSVTEAVRRLATPGGYFPLDGHPTAAGHALFARLLEPEVSARFEALARARSEASTRLR